MKVLILLLLSFMPPAYAWTWQDLWVTQDRQAQVLMDAKQYEQAKNKFERKDWRATAAFRAGDFQHAAALFQALDSADAKYNQGNALAYSKQYAKAIQAYNQSLAMNSANQDAVHNRKIVEDLLKKEKQQQEKQKNQEKAGQGQQSQQHNQDKTRQDQQNQQGQNQDKANQDKANQDKANQDKANQDKANQDKANQDKANQDKANQDKANQDKQPQQDQNQDQASQSKSFQPPSKEAKSNSDPARQEGASSPTEREQQQTKEQWLRLIPDDPGGFLREEFRRDYLRQQQAWYP